METPIGKVCCYLHTGRNIGGLWGQNSHKCNFYYIGGAGGGAYC